MTTKEAIQDFKSPDIYSLILFVLYKVRNIPEFSTISELAYVLDETNLLSLCEYFGGTTIKIPTINEVEQIMQALLIFQMVDIEEHTYDDAISLLGDKVKDKHELKINYNKICKVINEYNFTSRFS